MYSPEPEDKTAFTQKFDRDYTRFARAYDWLVKRFPIWRNWISAAIPHIQGPDVLEISFGTGYLLTQYAHQYRTCGIDFNRALTRIAQHNLQRSQVNASLQQASIEALPYKAETFDTIVNTMAFSGYPDGKLAMEEIWRVLKDGGRFVLVDIDYPRDRNWLGMQATRFWVSAGDILRDMEALLDQFGFRYQQAEIGGFGSVHLYIATKSGL